MLKKLRASAVVLMCTLSLFAFDIGIALAQGMPGESKSKLVNPLKVNSIQELLNKIIDVLVVFATPIIILFIMYAGFLFVTAKGDTGKVQDAKNALLWAVVGGVIVLGAKIISEVISGTVKTF